MQLNMEQRKLIQAKPTGHNLIKGVAGSGKTTVALHKTLFLKKHYCFGENERTLMVTYNRTLINYIKYLYNKIEDEHKDLYTNIFDDKENKVVIQTIDKIIYDYYMKTGESKKYKIDFDKKNRYSILTHCITSKNLAFFRLCPGVSGPCLRQFPETPSRGQSPTAFPNEGLKSL